MMWVINKLPHPWKLRVEEHGETGPGGLDVFEHGTSAYPDKTSVDLADIDIAKLSGTEYVK